jgi:hypothetical protein
MLNRYSAFVLLLVLQPTAASAQCWESSGLKSARAAHSEAATQYSTCLEDQARGESQARVENQASGYCKDAYSKLQSAKHDLETAISQYESSREDSCLREDGTVPLFRPTPVPLR